MPETVHAIKMELKAIAKATKKAAVRIIKSKGANNFLNNGGKYGIGY